ncbi:MAG: uroporphyrinogen-III synthase [Alphaproteobacteria bacterium]|nr:uroporphyrinogen-III synthase [Alphaproteobacteria bacterium]
MARVLVTRAAEDARPLCHSLEAHGHEPVRVPLLLRLWEVDALAQCAAEHPQADWLLVTSATTADVLAAGAPGAWKSARIGAVGPVTARKLEAIGRPAHVVPEQHTGAALVALLPDLTGKTVIYPKADLAPESMRDALVERGATVIEVVAYRNVPPNGHVERLAAALPVDATTLLSGSAAERLKAALGDLDPALLGRVVVIGPSTAKAAQDVGLPVHAVANPYTVNGLLMALDAELR